MVKTCLNAAYGKVHRGKFLSGNFLTRSDIKRRYSTTSVFIFALEYNIRDVQENSWD
jgi:hypothetical protein